MLVDKVHQNVHEADGAERLTVLVYINPVLLAIADEASLDEIQLTAVNLLNHFQQLF